MGFAMQVVFDSLGLAGQLLANSMGLSFAFNVDPLRGSSTAALGQLYIVLATLTFLALGGHLALLELLVASLHTLPVGTSGLGSEGLWSLVNWGGSLFSGAIMIALPGVTALMITNLAFGVVSRAAPSLNLFAVGFPISLVVGLLVVLAGMGPLQQGVAELIGRGFTFIRALVGG
jgi:flagellar biosynthetic protein FliR